MQFKELNFADVCLEQGEHIIPLISSQGSSIRGKTLFEGITRVKYQKPFESIEGKQASEVEIILPRQICLSTEYMLFANKKGMFCAGKIRDKNANPLEIDVFPIAGLPGKQGYLMFPESIGNNAVCFLIDEYGFFGCGKSKN